VVYYVLDLTDLYMRLRRADLDIAGTNVREKRHTVFRNETLRATSCTETDQQRWRRILSLQRTLKVSVHNTGCLNG